MILRTHILIIFAFLFSLSVQAQSEMEDVVYLKNGGITRGTILEIIPDSTLKIQTKDRNIFVYSFKEIVKVVKENATPVEKVEEKVEDPYNSTITYTTLSPDATTPSEDVKPKTEYKQSGYHGIIKFGPLGITSLCANFINGYQFNPYVLLGLGVGLDTYKDIGNNGIFDEEFPFGGETSSKRTEYFLPIYMDFRFHVSASKTTFFTYLNVGYSKHLKGSGSLDTISTSLSSSYGEKFVVSRGGTFFCPGIGLKIFVTKTVGIVADFGIKFQTYEADRYVQESIYNNSTFTYDNYYLYRGTFSKIAVSPMINIGMSF